MGQGDIWCHHGYSKYLVDRLHAFDHLSGWPAYHQSMVHASPLLYDIDKDGVREIALATYNGEVLFFR